jgi:hypothetical protein
MKASDYTSLCLNVQRFVSNCYDGVHKVPSALLDGRAVSASYRKRRR